MNVWISKNFDINSLNGQVFTQTSVEENIKAETNNQQCMDSIKIEDEENVAMFQQENTRVVHGDMNVIKIENENDGYEMFSQTNSFHIKVDKEDIAQQVVCNETLLSSTDSVKIECADEIKSNENVSGTRFLQKKYQCIE